MKKDEADAPEEREADLYAVSDYSAVALRDHTIYWLLAGSGTPLRLPAPGRVVAVGGRESPIVLLKNGDFLAWDPAAGKWVRRGNVYRSPASAR